MKFNIRKLDLESLAIAATLVFIIVSMKSAVVNAMSFSGAEREYVTKMNEHVLATWPEDGPQPTDHHCSYDPAYCNPTYAKFLREHHQ